MTIVVTVKINDGIVLAADSAATFSDKDDNVVKIYNNANKLFNLVKGLPIGTAAYGSGSIGAASIATLTKDLRRRLSGDDPNYADWKIDHSNYTLSDVSHKIREFFFEEKLKSAYPDGVPDKFFLGYKVCGYSSGADHPELWEVPISAPGLQPNLIRGRDSVGPNWDGEYEAMDRLILGTGSRLPDVLEAFGVEPEKVNDIRNDITRALYVPLVIPAMPIQDAVELARFMVETTIRYVRFNPRSETVGGPIEIAVITKHEGFKWVQRKLFFQSDLNPPSG